MRIVIVGAGLVGSTLADRLSRDGHDVTLVEKDATKARALRDSLDVQVVQGNGATAETPGDRVLLITTTETSAKLARAE